MFIEGDFIRDLASPCVVFGALTQSVVIVDRGRVDIAIAINDDLQTIFNKSAYWGSNVEYICAIRIKTRNEKGFVYSQAVHIALGFDTDGKQDVLGMWMAENESARFWLKVFKELKNRGVSDILIAVTDGLKGMQEALETAFPTVTHQTCNSLKMVNYKDYNAVVQALKPIYQVPNAEAARDELESFEASELGIRYPYIARQWKEAWRRVVPFFEFSPNVHKLIYTTNAIESLNRELRKTAKNRASFPTETTALKLLYLTVRNVARKWKGVSTFWRAALNEMTIIFADRLTPYIC